MLKARPQPRMCRDRFRCCHPCESELPAEESTGGSPRGTPLGVAVSESPQINPGHHCGVCLLTCQLACYNHCPFKMARRSRQLALGIRTWGGRRRGAGRKPTGSRPGVPHRRRIPHDPRCPVHVTLRATRGLPSLRGDAVFAGMRSSLGAGSRDGFRILHFSVQSDHVHLLVEADAPTRLARGVQGLCVRVAKAINRVLRRRGRVWADRYHAHVLGTPREVRNAFLYVLNNVRKHIRGARGRDPRSSAAWFTGWKVRSAPSAMPAPIVAPRTWLARIGWRRHGLLDAEEYPSPARARPATLRPLLRR